MLQDLIHLIFSLFIIIICSPLAGLNAYPYSTSSINNTNLLITTTGNNNQSELMFNSTKNGNSSQFENNNNNNNNINKTEHEFTRLNKHSLIEEKMKNEKNKLKIITELDSDDNGNHFENLTDQVKTATTVYNFVLNNNTLNELNITSDHDLLNNKESSISPETELNPIHFPFAENKTNYGILATISKQNNNFTEINFDHETRGSNESTFRTIVSPDATLYSETTTATQQTEILNVDNTTNDTGYSTESEKIEQILKSSSEISIPDTTDDFPKTKEFTIEGTKTTAIVSIHFNQTKTIQQSKILKAETTASNTNLNLTTQQPEILNGNITTTASDTRYSTEKIKQSLISSLKTTIPETNLDSKTTEKTTTSVSTHFNETETTEIFKELNAETTSTNSTFYTKTTTTQQPQILYDETTEPNTTVYSTTSEHSEKINVDTTTDTKTTAQIETIIEPNTIEHSTILNMETTEPNTTVFPTTTENSEKINVDTTTDTKTTAQIETIIEPNTIEHSTLLITEISAHNTTLYPTIEHSETINMKTTTDTETTTQSETTFPETTVDSKKTGHSTILNAETTTDTETTTQSETTFPETTVDSKKTGHSTILNAETTTDTETTTQSETTFPETTVDSKKTGHSTILNAETTTDTETTTQIENLIPETTNQRPSKISSTLTTEDEEYLKNTSHYHFPEISTGRTTFNTTTQFEGTISRETSTYTSSSPTIEIFESTKSDTTVVTSSNNVTNDDEGTVKIIKTVVNIPLTNSSNSKDQEFQPIEKGELLVVAASIASVLVLGLLILLVYVLRTDKFNCRAIRDRTMSSVKPRPLSVKGFLRHCMELNETPARLASEFQLLASLTADLSRDDRLLIGRLPENRRRNRYINILPFDDTRVILHNKSTETSDYINASYIMGYSDRVEYIATQGPKEETCQHFWQMVFDERVAVIAMVTQFEEAGKAVKGKMENKQIRAIFLYVFKMGRKAVETARNLNRIFSQGTTNERTAERRFQKFRSGDEGLEDEEDRQRTIEGEKCHNYFPKYHEQISWDDESLIVYCVTEAEFPVYTSRTLHVYKDNAKRVVTHLHFREWADFKVPETTDSMIEFCQAARQHLARLDNNTGLILTHCSAGVGRTGTLITVDILLQAVADGKKIDVFGTVFRLRHERMMMVQTDAQYAYIYKCIENSLLDGKCVNHVKTSYSESVYENIQMNIINEGQSSTKVYNNQVNEYDDCNVIVNDDVDECTRILLPKNNQNKNRSRFFITLNKLLIKKP